MYPSYSDIDNDDLLLVDSQDFWPDVDDHQSITKRPLREKNLAKNLSYRHVPHSERPPQVVAKRNARERRRVQAVNNAFVKLRNAVPIQNSRGKRISKVKTLLHAIEYIRSLDSILREYGGYSESASYDMMEYDWAKNFNYDQSQTGDWSFEKNISFPTGKYFS